MENNYKDSNSSASLIVMEKGSVRVFSLRNKSEWQIGRKAPGSVPDIPLSSAVASRDHGSLVQEGGTWYHAENPRNTNGTYYNGHKVPSGQSGKRYRVPLKNGDLLKIQVSTSSEVPVLMHFSTVCSGTAFGSHPIQGTQTVIGRAAGCQVRIPLDYVSSTHARIDCSGGQYYLSDCGSRAGTCLNGQKITGNVKLKPYDCVSICGKPLFFLGNSILLEGGSGSAGHGSASSVSTGGRVVLRADIQTKQVKNNSGAGMKELIRDIHLEIREGTLVALLGTAGAGKSTVMNCLNGMDLEGVRGTVIYRNVDLMRNFDQMKHMIGSVPQKKTFHPNFTPEQEFSYAARKRLPPNLSDAEIQLRVRRTLEMLSMMGVRNVPNSKLSGGEQTRVNVGIELVADRDLLCLDEPDQGLSPNYKHELFQIMRDLAHKSGKSVLSIIHDVSEIDMFDQVIMLAKVNGVGRLAFSGSPADARRYFGTDIQNAYELLERNPGKYVR